MKGGDFNVTKGQFMPVLFDTYSDANGENKLKNPIGANECKLSYWLLRTWIYMLVKKNDGLTFNSINITWFRLQQCRFHVFQKEEQPKEGYTQFKGCRHRKFKQNNCGNYFRGEFRVVFIHGANLSKCSCGVSHRGSIINTPAKLYSDFKGSICCKNFHCIHWLCYF